MNVLDEIIAFVAPKAALGRAAARARLQQLRNYEAGDLGRRTANWKTSTKDANAEIAPSLSLLRNRARDLRRNNAYAEAAVSSIVDNTIGYGIKPKPKARTATQNKRAAQAWKDHAETTAIDYDGMHDIYGLQALAMGAIVDSGAVIVRRRLLTTSQAKEKGLKLPFQIQVLEPDFLDSTRDGPQPDGSIDTKGIRFEPNGGVRGYWLYEKHPGSGCMGTVSSFIPARDVLHVFRVDRPGQVLGVPWAAPTMLRLRNFDEVEDAYIEREKIAACFAVFFTGLDAESAPKKLQLAERLEPGMMDFAPPGTGVEFANPPGVNGYRDFAWINLHAIAAGYGVPYEVFGDLSGVNFSSGRMGWQNYQRRIDRWQWQMFIPVFCGGVWSWFNSSLQFAGVVQEDIPAQWIPPRRMMVNPKEELAAMKDEVRNGFASWPQQVSSLGYDADEQIEEIAESNAKLDKAGVKLDCDPRFALPAGSAATAEKDQATNKEKDAEGNGNP